VKWAVLLALWPSLAWATGFTDIGQDIARRRSTQVALTGALRTRVAALHNLDLDRGPTPSGQPLYPVPLSDGQLIGQADLRLRSDLTLFAPAGGVAIKIRLDVLDNTALGGDAAGIPAASTTQSGGAIRVRRAYGEALTPLGLLTAGRAGSHWGLGMLVSGGDCADCDSGDAADRIAFVTPLAGLLWALAFDWTAAGPQAAAHDGRSIDLDRADDVRSLTFATLSWRSERSRLRRRRAGKTSFEWGAYLSYRWQDRDVPASYLPVAQPARPPGAAAGSAASMARGYRAAAIDGWARLTLPRLRVEAEAALLWASVDQPSLIPGVLLAGPVRSRQIGAALESEYGAPAARVAAGLDAGYASGDPAPGFGAFPQPGAAAPRPGDLDGAQASPPGDLSVDNFRFHPDYRIDRILFREIIGAVTDAVYLRPHARATVFAGPPGRLDAQLAAVASWAVEPASTPGQARPLGVELDPTLVYLSADGFVLAAEYALLLPMGGLDGPGRPAKPAQSFRFRLGFAY